MHWKVLLAWQSSSFRPARRMKYLLKHLRHVLMLPSRHSPMFPASSRSSMGPQHTTHLKLLAFSPLKWCLPWRSISRADDSVCLHTTHCMLFPWWLWSWQWSKNCCWVLRSSLHTVHWVLSTTCEFVQ